MRKTGTKNLLFVLLVMVLFAFTFTGCGFDNITSKDKTESSKEDKKDDEDEDDDDEEEEDDSEDDVDNEDSDDIEEDNDEEDDIVYDDVDDGYREYYGYIFAEDGEGDYYEGMAITVGTFEGGDCFYDLTSYYSDGSAYTSHYIGTYTQDDLSISVDVVSNDGSVTTTVFQLEEGEIISYNINYGGEAGSDATEIAGQYVYNDPVEGKYILTVNEDGTAVLDTPDSVLSGTIFMYGGEWDLMVYNEDYSESLDWMVYFSGKKFKYTPYSVVVNSQYAGTYSLDGELGAFDVTVEEDGTATATVTIDKKAMEFSGYISTADNDVVGFYLNNEESGYSLNLNVTYVGVGQGFNGEWNYEGSLILTRTLCAG